MFRRIGCGILLCAMAALAGACSDKLTTTTPTPVTSTQTFTGTLTPASAVVSGFTTLTGGPISATLTVVGPDPAQSVGFSLGTFNPTLNICTVVLDNPAAVQSAVFNATASTTGFYCVRVYDNGNVATAVSAGTADSFTYTVVVSHP
jgi:hypothetical protein